MYSLGGSQQLHCPEAWERRPSSLDPFPHGADSARIAFGVFPLDSLTAESTDFFAAAEQPSVDTC